MPCQVSTDCARKTHFCDELLPLFTHFSDEVWVKDIRFWLERMVLVGLGVEEV